MRKILVTLLIFSSAFAADAQYNALYDIAADQFYPYKFAHLERRNISPDCEERTTEYPVFVENPKLPSLVTVNNAIRRMYSFYMSDTFVDELQARFHKVVLNYQQHFPNLLNCINQQKVYAVNFTNMQVSIVSCQNGMVYIMNHLFYTVANAPVTQLQTNMFNEVLLVNLNTGAITRNPSLVIKDKQRQFTDLVRKRLDLYVESFRARGGNIMVDPEREYDEYGESDYPTEDIRVEEADYNGSDYGNEAEMEDAPIYEQESPGYNVIAPKFSPIVLTETARVKSKRTGIDSAVNLIQYSDLMVYWRNFSLFVRVSPYADMAAYIPNGIIEVDFSWKEIAPYLALNPSSLFADAPKMSEKQLLDLLKEEDMYPIIPFYIKDPELVNGLKEVKIDMQVNNSRKNNEGSGRIITYDDSGRISRIRYYNAVDTVPYSTVTYVYQGGKLLQTINFDRNGNVSSIIPAIQSALTAHENTYYTLKESSSSDYYGENYQNESRIYILRGRIIIEPEARLSMSEEDYNYQSFARIIHYNSDFKRSDMISLDYHSSVPAEQLKNEIKATFRKYHYSESGQLLVNSTFLAEYDTEGRIIFISGFEDNNFTEYHYDQAGRIREVKSRSMSGISNVVKLSYEGDSIYPKSILVYEPYQARTVEHLIEYR